MSSSPSSSTTTKIHSNITSNQFTSVNNTVSLVSVQESITSILGMLETLGQSLFPRRIMTSGYSGAFTVDSKNQMIEAFKHANFKDCRISAYPFSFDSSIKTIPNVLLLDMDLDDKLVLKTGREYAKQRLKRTVNKLLRELDSEYNISNVMVLWSGNGYHIYVPFAFDKRLEEQYEEFSKYKEFFLANNIKLDISEEFLKFAKKQLTNGKADLANNPSFKSMFLRIGGTINTKKEKIKHLVLSPSPSPSPSPVSIEKNQIVTIEHVWDYGQFENKENFVLPLFDDLKRLISEYLDYLNDKVIKHKLDNMMRLKTKENNLTPNSINSNYNNSCCCIYWIDTLLEQIQLDDYRKNAVDLILVPYFVNIKHLSDDETITRINEWLTKCDKVKPLDSNVNFDYKIRYQINKCKSDRNLKPIRFEETLSKMNPDLYRIIKGKMNQQERQKGEI